MVGDCVPDSGAASDGPALGNGSGAFGGGGGAAFCSGGAFGEEPHIGSIFEDSAVAAIVGLRSA